MTTETRKWGTQPRRRGAWLFEAGRTAPIATFDNVSDCAMAAAAPALLEAAQEALEVIGSLPVDFMRGNPALMAVYDNLSVAVAKALPDA